MSRRRRRLSNIQVPPPPFVPIPLRVPGYVAWQQGSDPAGNGTQPANGSALSTWVDKTGNGYDLDVSTGVAPRFTTNSIGGKATVNFNGTTQFLSYPNALLNQMTAGTGATIFIVSRTDTTYPPDGIIMSTYPYNPTHACNISLPYRDSNLVYWDYSDITDGGRLVTDWGGMLGVSDVWVFGQDASTTMNIWRDGVNIGTQNAASFATFGSDYRLDIGAGEGLYFWHGAIAEIIIYNRNLTDSERQLVTEYLDAEYNLGFKTIWKTDNIGTSASNQITIPTIPTGAYECVVHWGDSTSSAISTWDDPDWTHTYATPGTYEVTILNKFQGFSFNNGGDKLKLLDVAQWGGLQLGTNEGGYFYGCSNMTITATGVLNLVGTTSLVNAFRNCPLITNVTGISDWNTSSVIYADYAFAGCSLFTGSVGGWNMGACISIEGMFQDALVFNSTLNTWTGAFQNCKNTFKGALAFNQNIGNWNMVSCSTIESMFEGAIAFNNGGSYTINNWNTGGLAIYKNGFKGAAAFNQSIAGWNIATLSDATGFLDDSGFDGYNYNLLLNSATGWPSQFPLPPFITFDANLAHYGGDVAAAGRLLLTGTKGWTINDAGNGTLFSITIDTNNTSVGSTDNLSFKLPTIDPALNPGLAPGRYQYTVHWGDSSSDNISAWDDAAITHVYAAPGVYNITIDGWFEGWQFINDGDREKPTVITNWGNMYHVGTDQGAYFYGCTNLTITATDILDVSLLTNLNSGFRACSSITDIPNVHLWQVGNVIQFGYAFGDCTLLNCSFQGWDVRKGVNMGRMFISNHALNQSFSTWNTESAQNLFAMFNDCPLLDQDFSNFNFRQVITADGFLDGSALSITNYNPMLIAYAAQSPLNAITAGFGAAHYDGAAVAAHDILTGTWGWTISDGGTP